jgi:hypothetical protein
VSTEDGWPSEAYIVFSNSKRLVLQFGTIEESLKGVNDSDLENLFPEGYLTTNLTIAESSSDGNAPGSCYLLDNASTSSGNNSWAIRPLDALPDLTSSSNITALFKLTSNTTDCGISPLLTHTLLNTTADHDITPYRNLSYSSIWSWSSDEPKNYTTSSTDLMRCATTSASTGRWAVSDCGKKYHVACKDTHRPTQWYLSPYATTYSTAADACPDNSTFSAPASALENSYLTQTIRKSIATNPQFINTALLQNSGVLLALNSLHTPGCWVLGSQNVTCPYDSDSLMLFTRERTILVPTIAAIIVLVISALTVFSKVAGNRAVTRRTRRRRERSNGFVYEGVPS